MTDKRKREKLSIIKKVGIPGEYLPASILLLVKVEVLPNVIMACKTKHYGHSSMFFTQSFYKPMIIL